MNLYETPCFHNNSFLDYSESFGVIKRAITILELSWYERFGNQNNNPLSFFSSMLTSSTLLQNKLGGSGKHDVDGSKNVI